MHAPDLLRMAVQKQRQPVHGAGIAAHRYEHKAQESKQDAHPQKDIHGGTPF
jgi:hypothetical protein